MNASSSDCRPACAGGFIGSIVVNALLLYFAHHLLDWQIPWIRSTWSGALWAIDLSLGVSIFVNVLHLAVDARWFRNLVGSLFIMAVGVPLFRACVAV